MTWLLMNIHGRYSSVESAVPSATVRRHQSMTSLLPCTVNLAKHPHVSQFNITSIFVHILRSVAQSGCALSCLDYLWNIFQEFGDVCGVNLPGKRSSRKHSKNRRLILGNGRLFLFEI